MAFVKAVKKQLYCNMSIEGPTGSGKTYTALLLAQSFGKKICLIETEHGSASLYADDFDFDVCDISTNTHPNSFINALKEAEALGYDVAIVDSLTHAWNSTKNEVDKIAKSMANPNSYVAWGRGTAMWESLITQIKSSRMHVICTMRSKMAYSQEKDSKGRTKIEKIGLEPQVRDGAEYEFDISLSMTHDHFGSIGKSRCSAVDGWVGEKPGTELGNIIYAWLTSGEKQTQPPANATAADAEAAMREAQRLEAEADAKRKEKREANEGDRPAFDDYTRSAVLSIGAEPTLEVCQSFGYDDPSQVLPKDFRSVMKALKELMPKQ